MLILIAEKDTVSSGVIHMIANSGAETSYPGWNYVCGGDIFL